MPILSLSGALLLKKENNLRRTMKYFDAAEKSHAGADGNQIINFHWSKDIKVLPVALLYIYIRCSHVYKKECNFRSTTNHTFRLKFI